MHSRYVEPYGYIAHAQRRKEGSPVDIIVLCRRRITPKRRLDNSHSRCICGPGSCSIPWCPFHSRCGSSTRASTNIKDESPSSQPQGPKTVSSLRACGLRYCYNDSFKKRSPTRNPAFDFREKIRNSRTILY